MKINDVPVLVSVPIYITVPVPFPVSVPVSIPVPIPDSDFSALPDAPINCGFRSLNGKTSIVNPVNKLFSLGFKVQQTFFAPGKKT